MEYLRHQAYLKWLPIDIDPENCDFSDVDRVLKVLDDYALQKMTILHDDDRIPKIVQIQRYMRTYLRTTRLQRCVRAITKVVRAIRAMQRFSNRAPYQQFLYKFECVYGEEVEKNLASKARKKDR